MTLVELITAMMISVIVGAVVISSLLMTLSLYTQQQIKNRQYIIIDYVELLINEELRYASDVQITESMIGDTYSYLETIDGELVKDGTTVLCGESILQDHELRVEFLLNPNATESSNIYVEIYVDEGTEDEVMEAFYIKILNLELHETYVEEGIGATGGKVYYFIEP